MGYIGSLYSSMCVVMNITINRTGVDKILYTCRECITLSLNSRDNSDRDQEQTWGLTVTTQPPREGLGCKFTLTEIVADLLTAILYPGLTYPGGPLTHFVLSSPSILSVFP